MIDLEMVKSDLRGVLNQNFTIKFTHLKSGKKINCHFNKNTKIFFSDGMSGTALTVLFLDDDAKEVKLKDRVLLEDKEYEITKIEFESQVLKRAYLREI